MSRRAAELHHVTIRVDDEPDVLKRVALLNTALLKVIQGTRLIDVLDSDYEHGCIELLIEAEQINPSIVPGRVNVEIDRWSAHVPT